MALMIYTCYLRGDTTDRHRPFIVSHLPPPLHPFPGEEKMENIPMEVRKVPHLSHSQSLTLPLDTGTIVRSIPS